MMMSRRRCHLIVRAVINVVPAASVQARVLLLRILCADMVIIGVCATSLSLLLSKGVSDGSLDTVINPSACSSSSTPDSITTIVHHSIRVS